MKHMGLMIMCCVAGILAGCTGNSGTHVGGSGLIQIDGNTSDWDGVKPVMFDTTGDSPHVTGSDVTALYVMSDSDYVYIRLDLSNGNPADDMQIGVTFGVSPDSYVGNRYTSIYTSPNPTGAYRKADGHGIYLGPIDYVIRDGVIEISVARSVLGAPAISYVGFWTQLLSGTSLLDRPDAGTVQYLF